MHRRQPPLVPRPRYRAEAAHGAVLVLEALREYRTAETGMRRRTRSFMGMGERDLLALRHVLEAERDGTPITPRELAEKLGITTASTTALLDRLTRSGHVARRPHPTDRRSVVVVAATTDGEVHTVLGAMHRRILAAAQQLSPEQAATVAGFLRAAAEAVEDAGQEHPLHPVPGPAEHPR